MIGNDVVDLNLAKTESNWQRKGFLEKQFTQFEINEILSSANPFVKVWLFWSMKEAAYKCYVQEEQKRFAKENLNLKMVSELFFIDKNESPTKIINDKLVSFFADDIQLLKNDLGIPYLYQNNKKLDVAISKSHHGNYGAFAFSTF
mgnify:CR=1 FL=1